MPGSSVFSVDASVDDAGWGLASSVSGTADPVGAAVSGTAVRVVAAVSGTVVPVDAAVSTGAALGPSGVAVQPQNSKTIAASSRASSFKREQPRIPLRRTIPDYSLASKYAVISCIRSLWATPKGQRLSQWPQPTQAEALGSRVR